MNLFKIAPVFIGSVFIIIILIWGLIAFVGVKGCNAVKDKGLKNVVEQVWTGPSNDVPATVNTNN